MAYIQYLPDSPYFRKRAVLQREQKEARRAWHSADKIKLPSWGFWPVLSVTLCVTGTKWHAQELSPCSLCFLDSPPIRSQTGQVTKVLPKRNCNKTPLMSLTPQEMASGQASDISSLTSLGNSSAQQEEVMDLSPTLGKKYGPIWTELQRGKQVGGALPVTLKLQKALVSGLCFPHSEDTGPMRRVPVTHHHAQLP